MNQWYVVSTLPHQEARAEANLRRQGFRSWMPTIKRSRRHARRIDTVRSPLFPGYLFVELDLQRETWVPINSTYGVRRILCRDEGPAPAPTAFIEALCRTIDGDGMVAIPEPLKPGQQVRMIAGPFVDCVGTLLYLAAKDRVALLLEVLGQKVTTLVSRRALVPAA